MDLNVEEHSTNIILFYSMLFNVCHTIFFFYFSEEPNTHIHIFSFVEWGCTLDLRLLFFILCVWWYPHGMSDTKYCTTDYRSEIIMLSFIWKLHIRLYCVCVEMSGYVWDFFYFGSVVDDSFESMRLSFTVSRMISQVY